MPLSVIWRIIVLALLVGGTLAFFSLYERYEMFGSELLRDPHFIQGFEHWDKSGLGIAVTEADGALKLRVENPGSGVAVRQSLPNPQSYRLLRLSGELKTDNISPGKDFWQKGRLVLVSFDEHQRMMQVPHVVADLQGTVPWRYYQAIFHVPRQVGEIRVGAQLIGATGTLQVKHLSLREVREKERFFYYRGVGMALWMVGLVWLGLPWLSHLRLDLPHVLLFVAIAGIGLGTLTPVKFKVDVENEVGTMLATVTRSAQYSDRRIEQGEESRLPALGKWGHMFFFAFLAFTLCWAYPGVHRGLLLVGLLIGAAVTEVLQLFSDGRLPLLSDFLIDSVGLIGGMGLFQIIRAGRRYLGNNRRSS